MISSRPAALLWIERALTAVGVVLAVWCLAAFVQMWSANRMGPPLGPVGPVGIDTQQARTLPGEADTAERPATEIVAAKPGDWLARLEAPDIKLSATVLEGSDETTLQRAAGHIKGSASPGERGNIGIAGHRDTIFRKLRDIRVGHKLLLSTSSGTVRSTVTQTWIVDPKDVWVLDPTNTPAVTLVTCYPFGFVGHAPKRFIVRAEARG